ncbi:hypothetical protein AVEN_151511-1 [Araneus ventricosus]|uniref:Uncharacterized protein n=1 Tax=Araneus ventricosus TaxID=182803 RepID=A0A4Y2ISK1_ARAVE|nr:hypothetical protein AVEN_151511-1 [Araneus ventricosus]
MCRNDSMKWDTRGQKTTDVKWTNVVRTIYVKCINAGRTPAEVDNAVENVTGCILYEIESGCEVNKMCRETTGNVKWTNVVVE